MTVTFHWHIDDMVSSAEGGREGVVSFIRGRLEGVEAGARAEAPFAWTLPVPEADAPFTDWDQLTKAQVVRWLTHMPIAETLRDQVRAQLDQAARQPQALPWENRA